MIMGDRPPGRPDRCSGDGEGTAGQGAEAVPVTRESAVSRPSPLPVPYVMIPFISDDMGAYMAVPPEPNGLLEILKIAVPVLLGALVWAGQTLAQRAWTEYERRRDVYAEVLQFIDSLFEGGEAAERRSYLRAVRRLWLVGSDEVVRAANALSAGIRSHESHERLEERYRALIEVMRRDLRKRRWLPPNKTALSQADFPIEGPGQ